jgi:hypothetical protein
MRLDRVLLSLLRHHHVAFGTSAMEWVGSLLYCETSTSIAQLWCLDGGLDSRPWTIVGYVPGACLFCAGDAPFARVEVHGSQAYYSFEV